MMYPVIKMTIPYLPIIIVNPNDLSLLSLLIYYNLFKDFLWTLCVDFHRISAQGPQDVRRKSKFDIDNIPNYQAFTFILEMTKKIKNNSAQFD